MLNSIKHDLCPLVGLDGVGDLDVLTTEQVTNLGVACARHPEVPRRISSFPHGRRDPSGYLRMTGVRRAKAFRANSRGVCTRIHELLDRAPTSRPSAADAAEMVDLARHDPDFRIRVRAVAVLPFVDDRERAADALIACLHDRTSDGGGNVPSYAANHLADMNATRAIPDVEDWIAFLNDKPPYNEPVRQIMLKKAADDLARLKQAAATRPASRPA